MYTMSAGLDEWENPLLLQPGSFIIQALFSDGYSFIYVTFVVTPGEWTLSLY